MSMTTDAVIEVVAGFHLVSSPEILFCSVQGNLMM